MERTADCLAKLERMNQALRHKEPDRVPIRGFFWGGFLDRYIRPFEALRNDATEVIRSNSASLICPI